LINDSISANLSNASTATIPSLTQGIFFDVQSALIAAIVIAVLGLTARKYYDYLKIWKTFYKILTEKIATNDHFEIAKTRVLRFYTITVLFLMLFTLAGIWTVVNCTSFSNQCGINPLIIFIWSLLIPILILYVPFSGVTFVRSPEDIELLFKAKNPRDLSGRELSDVILLLSFVEQIENETLKETIDNLVIDELTRKLQYIKYEKTV
jgi:hypothetical protein